MQELYSEIIIPRAVFAEIEVGKEKQIYKDLSKINWINIIEANQSGKTAFQGALGFGEAETILLAKRISADIVLIDEKLGRYFARKENLKISGTLGVLIKAKRMGHLPEISPCLEKLSDNGIWISEALKKEVLIKVKEF